MLKRKLSILGFSIWKEQERHQANSDNSDVAHRAIVIHQLLRDAKPEAEVQEWIWQTETDKLHNHIALCTITLHISVYCLHFAHCSLHHSARWPPIEVRCRAEKSERAEKLCWIELKTVPKISLSPAHQNPRILFTVGGQGYALWDGVHWTGDRKSGAKSEKRETENMVPRVKATESQNASLLKSHSPRAAGSSLSCSDHRHRFEAGHLLACTWLFTISIFSHSGQVRDSLSYASFRVSSA